MKLHITNARKIDCQMFFPPTAKSVTLWISNLVPNDSAVLIYTSATGDKPVRFDGPMTVAEVPVSDYAMYAQSILKNETFELECLGYRDDLTR